MSSSEPLDIKNYIGLTGDTPIRFIASDVDGTLVNTLLLVMRQRKQNISLDRILDLSF